jgi:hypothetical protein
MYKDNRTCNTKTSRIYDNINRRKYVYKIKSTVKKQIKEVRMFVVSRRDTKTLLPIIKKHIKPGSEIISDEWRTTKKIL